MLLGKYDSNRQSKRQSVIAVQQVKNITCSGMETSFLLSPNGKPANLWQRKSYTQASKTLEK
jgi:hypothetical protein